MNHPSRRSSDLSPVETFVSLAIATVLAVAAVEALIWCACEVIR